MPQRHRGTEDRAEGLLMANETSWPLWEVFTQGNPGQPFEHAGSLHATDAEHALLEEFGL